MDLVRKFNRCNRLILLLAIFGFSSASTLAQTNTPSTKSVWQNSYDLEYHKKYAEAANILKPILVKSPKDEFILNRLGWLNYLQLKYNVSEDYYHKALDVNSDSIDARLGLTLPLMAQLRWKEAAIYANQVISMSAWGYLAHIRLMACESGQSEWETLGKHAEEFIKRYPTDANGFVFLARSQAMLGKKDLAILSYKDALVRAPTNAEAIKYLENKK